MVDIIGKGHSRIPGACLSKDRAWDFFYAMFFKAHIHMGQNLMVLNLYRKHILVMIGTRIGVEKMKMDLKGGI